MAASSGVVQWLFFKKKEWYYCLFIYNCRFLNLKLPLVVLLLQSVIKCRLQLVFFNFRHRCYIQIVIEKQQPAIVNKQAILPIF